MPPLFNKLIKHTLARYVFIGGVSYVIEIGFLLFIVNIFNVNGPTGVAISFWVGLVSSFLLQKFVTFNDKGKSGSILLKQSVVYIVLVGVNYSFTIIFVAMVEPITSLIISRTLALLITTGWNFIIYSKVIFKKNTRQQ